MACSKHKNKEEKHFAYYTGVTAEIIRSYAHINSPITFSNRTSANRQTICIILSCDQVPSNVKQAELKW